MAKAWVGITCAECGEEFTHTKIVHNTTEKEQYEDWARKNIDLCPKCYRKWKMAEFMRKNEAEIVHMAWKTYKEEWAGCKKVPNSYDKSDKSVDVIITKKDRAVRAAVDCLPNGPRCSLADFWEQMCDAIDKGLPPVPESAPDEFKKMIAAARAVYFGGKDEKT